MFIHNIRTGFATNSSSTHSLVIWADGDTREAEGTFSCYVDAVKKRMYKSSYDRSEGVDLANPYRFHDHWMSVRS